MLRSAHPSFPTLTLLLHHLACMAGVWKQERTEHTRQTREGRGSLSPRVSPRTRNSLPRRRSQRFVTRSCRNAWRIPKKRLRGRLLRIRSFLRPLLPSACYVQAIHHFIYKQPLITHANYVISCFYFLFSIFNISLSSSSFDYFYTQLHCKYVSCSSSKSNNVTIYYFFLQRKNRTATTFFYRRFKDSL